VIVERLQPLIDKLANDDSPIGMPIHV